MPAPTTDGGTVPVAHHETYGLDFTACAAMAPGFGIRPDANFFERLRIFEDACLAIWRGEKRCGAQQKANCTELYKEHLAWTCGKCDRK